MKKEYSPYLKVINLLILAFVASSGGKFNYSDSYWDRKIIKINDNNKIYYHKSQHTFPLKSGVCEIHPQTWFEGYKAKEPYLIKALELLNKNKYCGIRYHISYNEEDRAPYLISFLIKNKNEKDIYISYHSFDKKTFASLVGKGGKPIRYRHTKGADAVKQLQAILNNSN